MLDLYEKYYKLSADPFRLGPDHRFVLEHRSYAKSKAYLEYALHRGEGFIVITGGAGTGKTTLISETLAKLDTARVRVAMLNSTQLESRDLLHMVAASFGLSPENIDKVALLLSLEDFLKQQAQKGKRSVLIVDEAQGLSQTAVEELRLLANLQFNNRLLLQVFLVGQEILRELIDAPEMDHLRQRIVAASHIDRLTPDETLDYIEHRLRRVGWQGDPELGEEVLSLIYKFSEGIPRRINLICSRLLLFGAMEKKHVLVGADAENVIEDLKREHLVSPLTEMVNGTVCGGALVKKRVDQDAGTFLDSLPRRKKKADNPEKSVEYAPKSDVCRKDRIDCKVQESEGRSKVPEPQLPSMDEISTEISELKLELEDSSRGLDESTRIKRPPNEQEFENKSRQSGRADTSLPFDLPDKHDTANVSETAILDTVGSRRMQKVRSGNKGRRRDGVVISMVFGLLIIGVITVAVLGKGDVSNLAGVIEGIDDHFERIFSGVGKHLDKTVPVASEASNESPPVLLDVDRKLNNRLPDVEPAGSRSKRDVRSSGNPDAAKLDIGLTKSDNQLDDTSPEVHIVNHLDLEIETFPASEKPDSPAMSYLSDTSAGAGLVRRRDPPEFVVQRATAKDSLAGQSTRSEDNLGHELELNVIDRRFIDQQELVLRQEATDRLERKLLLSKVVPNEVTAGSTQPPPVKQLSNVVKREAEAQEASVIKRIMPSQPKISAQKKKPVPAATTVTDLPEKPEIAMLPIDTLDAIPRVHSAASDKNKELKHNVSRPQRAQSIDNGVDHIKSTLLSGFWYSRGKPAALLPSHTTSCQRKGTVDVVCSSAPNNIDTKHGRAVYKAKSILQNFSASGEFNISYQTFVRLTENNLTSGNNNWHVSKYSMACRLKGASLVLCNDEKGAQREYRSW